MKTFLWVIVPYLCLATFVVGHLWRYRYDKFGWTTRSSQLYEDRLLRLGSPLFHFGMLGVVGGHVIGLLIPKPWTEAVGISESAYHLVAVVGGLCLSQLLTLYITPVVYIYLDRIDRRLRRKLEPQLEETGEGERPHVVAAE